MLDLETLRVVQAAVAVCAFVLVFLGTYRTTRAPFAGWWSAALAASGLTTVILMTGEASLSVGCAAFGNAISVVGALFTWVAARSLRQRRLPWWVPVVVGVVVAVGTEIEHPRGDAWPGGAVLLVGMSLFVGLAASELWALRHEDKRAANRRSADGEKIAAIVSMAVASTVLSAFYAMRVVAYATVGPASWFYETWAGPLMTTFLMTLVLLVVTYSVTTLSNDRLARHWQQRAMNDDLTGLLTRTEFGQRAGSVLRAAPGGTEPAVIVADLDHFKAINDRFGHAAGDRALVSFADAVRQTLSTQDVAARFGGEEFVFLIADADRQRIGELARDIDQAFAAAAPDPEVWPTVSYGAALWDRRDSLDQLIVRADGALYEAKRRGRAQTVIDEGSGVR
ncbi:GGDEF domain-containing protein [Demequina lutea]|uniref:Diguanylate cyclase (GGDEF)-like protein n=1 Tax=Demequina lutea TaxID=431489 RepID=A0A7Y9ZDP2_9MICO|nr:GGDEF domain-containing protein [Demequina lutea]NYI41456.1 diguanylate cyclase (GGDEF)-like protein [Demequina lutea]